jgi:hypothetical protein
VDPLLHDVGSGTTGTTKGATMANDKWGHCQHCKHFGSPAHAPLVNEEARCNQPQLSRHQLTVFGACGCTLHETRPGLSEDTAAPIYAT